MTKSEAVLGYLRARYPAAATGLVFRDDFEALVAIALSAQTSDKAVNQVTPLLFARYPNPQAMASAPLPALEGILRSIGLYRTKALHIQALSRKIMSDFGGRTPTAKNELRSLPGIGNKTAGVFLLERAGLPAIPVDTHVGRVAYRLRYVPRAASPERTEAALEKSFPPSDWIFLHHALIAFGREQCRARKPACSSCGLQGYCRYFAKQAMTKGK